MDEPTEQPQEPKKKKLSRGKPWQKGQSGNPKGRPPVKVDVTRHFLEAMSEKIPDKLRETISRSTGFDIPKRWTYLQLWVRRMRDDALSAKNRNDISKFIWERLEGKVKEQVSHSFDTPLEMAVAQKEAEDPYAPDQLAETIRCFVEAQLIPENIAEAILRNASPSTEDNEILPADAGPN